MCGIFAIFGNACNDVHCNGNGTDVHESSLKKRSSESLREMAFRCSGKQRHRGPDKTGIVHFQEDNVIMVHERLRIVGVLHGDQPLQSDNGDITLVANGEIYNFLEISEELSVFYNKQYIARSDCDVIIGLYEKYGDELVNHMTGMFAFALYDRKNKKVFAARDPFGILSMYIGEDVQGNIWVASEMKCLAEKCSYVQNFPTGKLFHPLSSMLHIHSRMTVKISERLQVFKFISSALYTFKAAGKGKLNIYLYKKISVISIYILFPLFVHSSLP